VPETGTSWVLSWILPAARNVIVIAELAEVEFSSLLSRRQREGTMTSSNAAILQSIFLLHGEKEYLVVPVESDVLRRARQLVGKYPLRTFDAIQLACAVQAVQLLSSPMNFISSDTKLLAAATAEGFTTGDPNAHP